MQAAAAFRGPSTSRGSECSKCMKLQLFCEEFTDSVIPDRCLRCNHESSEHCLPPGSSPRPFPILLFPSTQLSLQSHSQNHLRAKEELAPPRTALSDPVLTNSSPATHPPVASRKESSPRVRDEPENPQELAPGPSEREQELQKQIAQLQEELQTARANMVRKII